MMNMLAKCSVGVLLALLTSSGVLQAASNDPQLSEAEKILWMADHLKNVALHEKLKYAFSKAGTLEQGFEDRVQMEVTGINDDSSRDVAIDFFTGDRHLPLEPRQRVTGNQILAVYLDGDLHEMHRLAKGSRPYFQRRLKTAFADHAKVENVTFEFAGKKVTGKKVVVTPYADDPRRNLFDAFANKVYEFTFSDSIPGTLYRIHTLVPGAKEQNKGAAVPLVEETLTLVEAVAGK